MERKSVYAVFLFVSLFVYVSVFNACKKDIVEPEAITISVTNILSNAATVAGMVHYADADQVISKGFVWNIHPNPDFNNHVGKVDLGNVDDPVMSHITNLIPNTTYYVRVWVLLKDELIYGNELVFKTVKGATFPVIDLDGNVYDTIRIGTQRWLKENLKTTRWNNGTSVPTGDFSAYNDSEDPLRAWYDNDSLKNGSVYGALYNYYAVSKGNLCPEGWHVPSTEEWQTLIHYLGGSLEAGRKLKQAGDTHWSLPNLANNASGFTALPGGYISVTGACYDLKNIGSWWSSTPSSENRYDALGIWMRHNETTAFSYFDSKSLGLSVRCLMD